MVGGKGKVGIKTERGMGRRVGFVYSPKLINASKPTLKLAIAMRAGLGGD